MARRVLILGNSGAGKTTLAARIAHGLPVLDLDTVVWRRDAVGVRNAAADVRAGIDAFVAAHRSWIAEGSYASCAEHLSPHATELLLVNPGIERALAHHAARPWEPHKYADPAEQEARRAYLAEWVASYGTRDDEFGLAAHRRVFDAFPGPKRVLDGRALDVAGAPPDQLAAYAFNAAINARDLDDLASRMTDDHTFEDTAGGVISGRAACERAWAGFFGAFPDYLNLVDGGTREGDVVTLRGRSVCAAPGLDGPAEWVATLRDGKVARWQVREA